MSACFAATGKVSHSMVRKSAFLGWRFARRQSHPCPETHRRAQRLQSEGPSGKNARKSATGGISSAGLTPLCGVLLAARFSLPARARKGEERRRTADSSSARTGRKNAMPLLTELVSTKGASGYKHGAPDGALPGTPTGRSSHLCPSVSICGSCCAWYE